MLDAIRMPDWFIDSPLIRAWGIVGGLLSIGLAWYLGTPEGEAMARGLFVN